MLGQATESFLTVLPEGIHFQYFCAIQKQTTSIDLQIDDDTLELLTILVNCE